MAEEKKPIISIKNLNVTYHVGRHQEIQALQDISLEIYPGEFIIFFGPSGCGKSTLLYSLSGLETHARGDIRVAGHEVTKMRPTEIARFRQKEVGMIFQAFYLIPSLTVFKNVLVPQMAIGADLKMRRERVKMLLEHFGVGSQSGKLPTELSGGQQQRVAICRALVNDPDILLADEPVGNLDSKSATDVIDLIREQNATQKKTVILVTHDPSHLHLAHRVFYLKDGKIIATKVNEQIAPIAPAASRPEVPKDLELLARTFSNLTPEQVGTLLIPFKAKEIVSEAISGFSLEQLERIEREVQQELIAQIVQPVELTSFLDDAASRGGLGLDHRTAARLAGRINQIVAEIRRLQAEERASHDSAALFPAEAVTIRQHLVGAFNLHLPDVAARHRLDTVLTRRLKNEIDRRQLTEAMVAEPPTGLGWARSVADRIAMRVELIMLGKFHA